MVHLRVSCPGVKPPGPTTQLFFYFFPKGQLYYKIPKEIGAGGCHRKDLKHGVYDFLGVMTLWLSKRRRSAKAAAAPKLKP